MQQTICYYLVIFVVICSSTYVFAARRIQDREDMEFGSISYATAPISITMVTDGSLTSSANFSYNAGQVISGEFNVYGNNGDSIIILVPSTTTLTSTTGAGSITINNYTFSGGDTSYTVYDRNERTVTRQIQATATLPNNSTGLYRGNINLSAQWTHKNGRVEIKSTTIPVSIDITNTLSLNETRQLDFGTILIENNTTCIVNLSQNNQMNSTCPQVNNSNTGLYQINTSAILNQEQINISNANQLSSGTGNIITTSNEQVYLKQISGGYQIEATGSLVVNNNTPVGTYTGNIYITINY